MEQQKGATKKFLKSRWFLIGGSLFFALLAYFFAQKYYQNYILRVEINHMLEEAQKVENTNAELKAILEKVKSPAYAEQIGRTNFGLIKPGENQVIVIGGASKKDGQTNSSMLESIRISNPRQWWNYFFNSN
ncbi:MAG: septum formation initiator family protein [Patescibacteria group bacterium]|jgi:cell division protein FtsB